MRFDAISQEAALRVLAQTGNASAAAKAAGVSYGTLRKYVREDPDFAERFEDAMREHVASLERVAIERGTVGVPVPKSMGGGEVVWVNQPSDRLLLAALAARDPDRWAPSTKVHAKITTENEIDTFKDLPQAEREVIFKIIEREAKRLTSPETEVIDAEFAPAAEADGPEDLNFDDSDAEA